MARKKASENKIDVGNIRDVSGEVNIAAGDIYKGYTAEQVSVLLTQITSQYQRKPLYGRCPYKGLDVFEEEDAELFFGRERLVEDLIERVKQSRTVFITGPSGSGKSSLVRAGLIHALKQGAIRSLHSERWLYETMKPGREPIKELSLAFSRLKSPELANYFQAHGSDVNILNECTESVLSGKKDQRFVLFIDQFEEIFSPAIQEVERLTFINMLAHAGTVENGRVIVLFAMRSDFVSNCATYLALNELLSQEFRQIGAMQPEELVSAIALPARQVGLPIEDELIARIINDMKGEPGVLPLMQFALKDLFDSQEEKSGVIALTLEDYLRHGGIQKSLERHADASFAALDEKEQNLARSIFSGLIETGRGTQDTRRTALFDELVPVNTNREDVQTVVQRLADARLIITDEQAGIDTVTLAHEKLIEAWPWLNKLVKENREVIALQNEIANNAKEWEENDKDESYLYAGTRLANAREKFDGQLLVLNSLAQEFVRICIEKEEIRRLSKELQRQKELDDARRLADAESQRAAMEKNRAEEQTHSANKLLQLARYLSIALIVAVITLGIAVFFSIQTKQQANILIARQLAEQSLNLNLNDGTTAIQSGLLAVEAGKRGAGWIADQAMRRYLNVVALPQVSMTIDGDVSSVAISPNGRYVVSGNDDGIASVWEVSTGKEVAHLNHYNSVTSVAFSSDGKYVVSGDYRGIAYVWEATTGKEISHKIHNRSVESVSFSPDDQYVVSNTVNVIRVWETISSREIARKAYDFPIGVTSVALSPDGEHVASGSSDGIVLLWEITTGKEVARIETGSYVNSVAFSPNSHYIVTGSSDGSVYIWETANGKKALSITQDHYNIEVLTFSPSGKYLLLVGNRSKFVGVWNVTTGKEVGHMTHDGSVYSAAFSPDSKYVVSGSSDGTARVWEATTGREIARTVYNLDVSSVVFSPDGNSVISSGCNRLSIDGYCTQSTVSVWRAISRQEIAVMNHDEGIYAVTFSPDGKYILSASQDGTARLWEAQTGKQIRLIKFKEYASSIAFSPDGRYFVAGGGDESAIVMEVKTGKVIARLIGSDVAFSPNGKYIVSGGNFTAHVWEVLTGKEIAHMAHTDSVYSVAYSPDGQYIVSASRKETIVWEPSTGKEIYRFAYGDTIVNSVAFDSKSQYILWQSYYDRSMVLETKTGKEIFHLPDHSGPATFSPDGKYIVWGSDDNSARVWEVSTGQEIVNMPHDAYILDLAFSPDGRFVTTESADNTIRVWDVLSGKPVARIINVNFEDYSALAFSPDGRFIASGDSDGTVRVWYWKIEDLINEVCKRLPRNLTSAEWVQYIGDKSNRASCPNLPMESGVVPENLPIAPSSTFASDNEPIQTPSSTP